MDAFGELLPILFYDGDPDTIIHYLTAYEQQAVSLQQMESAGRIRTNIITILYNFGRYAELQERAADDLAFMAEGNAWIAYFNTYEKLVSSYFLSNQPEKALEAATRCYEASKLIDAPEARTWPLYILGIACRQRDRFEEAVVHYRSCIEAAGTDKANVIVKMYAYIELCMMLYTLEKLEDLGQTLAVWDRELMLLEQKEHSAAPGFRENWQIQTMNHLLVLNAYDKLEPFVDQVDNNTPVKSVATRTAILFARQEIATAHGQYERALDYLAQRCEVFTASDNTLGLSEALVEKAYILARLNPDACIETFKQALALKDSIAGLDTQARLDELRTVYEVDTLTAEKERNRNYFLFALGGCGLLAFLLGIWIYYSRLITRKNRALARQISELAGQQEQRDNEMLRKTTFLPAEGETETDDDNFCPDTRKDRLCIAIRDIILKEKIYRDPTLTRDAVVERLGTNKDLFIDAFQYCFRMSFTDYINTLRLKDAVNLLDQSDLPIEEISEKVGFGTIRTFQHQFLARYNMSPKDYRSQRKADKTHS